MKGIGHFLRFESNLCGISCIGLGRFLATSSNEEQSTEKEEPHGSEGPGSKLRDPEKLYGSWSRFVLCFHSRWILLLDDTKPTACFILTNAFCHTLLLVRPVSRDDPKVGAAIAIGLEFHCAGGARQTKANWESLRRRGVAHFQNMNQ